MIKNEEGYADPTYAGMVEKLREKKAHVTSVEFLVEGKPQGKGRPRFSMKTKRVYTPVTTRRYEKQIREAYSKAGGKLFPEQCYIKVTVNAYFKIPKSYTKGKRLACAHNINRPDKKPDTDNILKVVMDALNKVAYSDDSKVVEVRCNKWYYTSASFLKIRIQEIKR